MRRGTTPTLKFNTPYAASLIDGGFVTFRQRGKMVIDKPLDDSSVTIEDNKISVDLSQAETLSLTIADDVDAQIRLVLKTGKRAASNVVHIPVFEILKDGEI